MKKLKVLTVVGTRPEIIRLSCVLQKLDASPAIEHVLVHTGQNYDYELNEVFFEDLRLRKPDYFLNAAGKNATATAGQILICIDPVLEEVQPDAFLVLGDTNSCLCAIAAKKRHIPIFHMEAGNRCFDQRVPEESNRKIVDHISDINLTYSSIAREYLLREGLPADRIIKTGSPMFEVLNQYLPFPQTEQAVNRDVNYLLFQGDLIMKPDKKRFAYLAYECDLLSIQKVVNDTCLESVVHLNTYTPVFENQSTNEVSSVNVSTDSPKGFLRGVATENYVYALYSGANWEK